VSGSSSHEELAALDKAHVWHPFTAQKDWAEADPLILERGEGVYLFDTKGNRYLDGVSSLWCNVHGHRHPTLDAAIRRQLDAVAHTTLLGASHPEAIRLAKELVDLAPPGLTRVFYSDDGATAVEVAVKLAFQYWRQKERPEPNRRTFLAFGGAYHGDTLGDVSLGNVDRFHKLFEPLLFPTLRAPAPYCYRCPLGLARPDCAMACVEEVDRILAAHPGEVAGVVVEPMVQGAAGMVVAPGGYLKRLREITRAHGTLLIADEVAVGFGRTGRMFACEHEGVTPDLLCLAKGLTGGYLPLAATLATEEVHRAFFATAAEDRTFQHGHTYGGNPLGAAVARATLQVFRDERTLERLEAKVDLLRDALGRVSRLDHVGDVRQSGLIAGIELVADRATRRPFPREDLVGARVCRAARAYGLLIRPLGDVIVIFPPLAITEAELAGMLDVVERCIVAVTTGEAPAGGAGELAEERAWEADGR
jgi:adenosylmethionine-8-amino-7-oxononanoate aminotransferase